MRRLTPAEVFTRNFWFCAVEDQSSFVQHDRIGVGQHHARSRLPALRLDLAAHPAKRSTNRSAACRRDVIRKFTLGERFAACTSHPVPAEIQQDPNAF